MRCLYLYPWCSRQWMVMRTNQKIDDYNQHLTSQSEQGMQSGATGALITSFFHIGVVSFIVSQLKEVQYVPWRVSPAVFLLNFYLRTLGSQSITTHYIYLPLSKNSSSHRILFLNGSVICAISAICNMYVISIF